MKLLKQLKQNDYIYYLWIFFKNLNNKTIRQQFIDFYRTSHYLFLQGYSKDNKNNIFYLIDPVKSYTSGFCSNLDQVLLLLAYADKHGFTPVIFKSKDSHYNELSGAWSDKCFFEYYFEQPCNINIEQAINNSWFIYAKTKHVEEILRNPNIDEIKISMLKKYFTMTLPVKKELNDRVEKYIGSKKVLGIKYRGSDYFKKFKNHPIPVSIEELISQVKKIYKNYDSIYLATEDQNALDEFIKTFGNQLMYDVNQERYGKDKSHVDINRNIENNAYKSGFDILSDLWILSHCSGLIGSRCGVTYYAKYFNEAFSERKFVDYICIDKGIRIKGVDSLKDRRN